MEQGKIMEAEVPTVRVGASPTGLMAPPPTTPSRIFTDRMPFLPPNQQRQSTEGTRQCLTKNSYVDVCVNTVAGAGMLGNVCRRSSYGPGGGGGGSTVRRAASMLVPVSVMEQAMLSGYQQDGGVDRSNQGPVTARPTSILDGMSRSCSVLPPYSDNLDDDDGLLLPPSPFRSPDFDEDDSSCLDGVLASCGYGTPPSLPQPPPASDRGVTTGQRATNGHRERHLAILADFGRPSDAGNFVWTSLPSPDDVTPTNENQPHGFGPNCRLVGPLPPPAPPPPLGDKCPPVRYSDL